MPYLRDIPSELDTYFAAARGYQGEKGDVKALAMKKWYNTNYHYMVPELDDSTEIKLVGTKPFELFSEALAGGVKTKPVITGAYTFLKLARYKGTKKAADFVQQTADAYSEILKKFIAEGAEWVQFDEPSLVKDMTAEDISLFTSLRLEIPVPVRILSRRSFIKATCCHICLCSIALYIQ